MADVTKNILLQLDLNMDKTIKALDEAKEKAKGFSEEQERIKKLIDETTKAGGQNSTALKNLSDEYLKVGVSIKANAKEQQDLNKTLIKTEQLNNAEKDSLLEKKIALSLANAEYQKYSSEVKKTDSSVIALGKNIRQLTDELKAEEKSLGDNRRNVGNYEDAITGAIGKVQGLGNTFGSLPGPIGAMSSSIGAATTAARAFIATPLGLILAGIALIIASVAEAFGDSEENQNKFAKIMGVIGSVVENFKNILGGIGELIIGVFENPKQALEDFGKLVKENIVNRFNGLLELVPALGKAISLLFEGKFAESGKVALNAVSKIGTGVNDITGKIQNASDAIGKFSKKVLDEAEIAATVANKRSAADKIERDLIVQRAKLESDVAEYRLKAREKDLYSLNQRQEFTKKASDLQDDLYNKEVTYLQLRADAARLELTYTDQSKENLTKVAEAEAEVSKVKTKRLTEQRAILREEGRLNNEEAANNKNIADEKKKLNDEKNKLELAIINSLNEIKINNIISLGNLEVTNEQEKILRKKQLADQEVLDIYEKNKGIQGAEDAKNAALLAINENYLAEKAIQDEKDKDAARSGEEKTNALLSASDKKKEQDLKASQQRKSQSIEEGVNNVKNILNKESAAYKAVAVGQTLVETYKAAQAAFAPPPVGAGGIAGAFLGATIIASGIAAVAKINSTKTGYYSGGFTGYGNPTDVSTDLGIKPYTYHKNEYVVPNNVLGDYEGSSLVMQLERIRTNKRNSFAGIGGFAVGGFTQPNYSTQQVGNDVFDQYQSNNNILRVMQLLPNPVVYVDDINLGQSNLTLVSQRASS